ncbi:MAG TPA: murein biosynthesis integral membrane protein MurJ [Acidimicrobiia bacterium]|nr:murein biosynthesis integral membrane protein MurJ [Acidimicrobiia bacterium]
MSPRGRGRSIRPHDTGQLVRSSVVVGVGTALSRVTGLLWRAAAAYAIGITALSGTYAFANETPNMLYELIVGGVLTATLVPQFVRHFQDDDEEATSAVVTVSVMLLIGVAILGVLLAPLIADLLTLRVHGSQQGEQRQLATDLLRLFMPQIAFYGFTALATALLQARRRFAAAAFAPILNNVVLIGLFLALPRLAGRPITVARVLHDTPLLLFLGLGTTAGIVAMALALVPALRGARVHLRFLPAWRHRAVAIVVRLSGWTIGYVIANQIALWVVLVLANGQPGGPAAYLLAYTLFQLPHGLFAVSIMTTAGPELAAAARDLPALRHRFARALRLVLTIVVPSAALAVALARPVVVALLQRGAFTGSNSALVAHTLVGFAVGLPFFSVYLFSLRAYYSVHDTRTPFIINCLENAVNIGLALAFIGPFGIAGLGYAFSGAYAVAALVTLALLSRRLGGLQGRGIETTFVKVGVVSAFAGTAAWFAASAVGWAGGTRAVLATVLGALVGFVGIAVGLTLTHVEEWQDLRSSFGPARRRRGGGRAGVGR